MLCISTTLLTKPVQRLCIRTTLHAKPVQRLYISTTLHTEQVQRLYIRTTLHTKPVQRLYISTTLHTKPVQRLYISTRSVAGHIAHRSHPPNAVAGDSTINKQHSWSHTTYSSRPQTRSSWSLCNTQYSFSQHNKQYSWSHSTRSIAIYTYKHMPHAVAGHTTSSNCTHITQ